MPITTHLHPVPPPGPRAAQWPAPRGVPDGPAPVLDVVIPVYNEETDLEPCVRRLHAHLSQTFPYPFQITIADNASVDGTYAVAAALRRELPGVDVVHLEQKGRGRALSAVWSASQAPVLAYMDVDLSTDLAALLPLVAPLISGHSDLAIGSRLAPSSRVVRGAKREIISRCYNLILRGTLAARFSDAQCGFKAIRRDVAEQLLPLVRDTGWFFDTELLVLAERAGLRIHEVPVDWVDDPDSRVDIVATALADLRGIARLTRALATGALPLAELRRQLGREVVDPPTPGVPAGLTGQLMRFAGIGVASTLAYLVIFALLRVVTGAQTANLLALLITAVGNTAANRRLTFGVTGARGAGRHHVQGLAVFALGLALTSGSLAALAALAPSAGRLTEIIVLVLANLAATVLRFLLLRGWVFRRQAAARSGWAASSGGPGGTEPVTADLRVAPAGGAAHPGWPAGAAGQYPPAPVYPVPVHRHPTPAAAHPHLAPAPVPPAPSAPAYPTGRYPAQPPTAGPFSAPSIS